MIRRKKVPTSIEGIEFDALISKNKTYESDIPDYPVESGFSVSDNISIKPVQLSLELYVTPTPVTWAKEHAGGIDWVDQVCEQIENLYFDKKLVTIITPDEVYENMGITSISISDSVEEGYAKVIACNAKTVYETRTDTVDIPAEIAQSGASNASAGIASSSSTSPTASSGSGGESDGQKKEDSKRGRSILYGVADGLDFF